MVQNTSKWGSAKARERYASGGKIGSIDDTFRDYFESGATDEPGMVSLNKGPINEPASAERARNVAANRVRNSRATPNSFPVGGEPKE